MLTAQIDQQLERLGAWTPRKATPVALQVKIDGSDKSFLIDPATARVKTPPPAYGWTLGFDYKELRKFFRQKGYPVVEVMGKVAPVLG